MGTMRIVRERMVGITGNDVGSLMLRLFAGLAMALAHGVGKVPPSERFIDLVAAMGFPLPVFFAWAAAFAEFGGGLLLAIGLATRPAAFFLLFSMLVASFVQQAGDPFLERELSLLYCAVAAHFMVAGAGRLSLDALFANRFELLRSRLPSLTPRPAAVRFKIDA